MWSQTRPVIGSNRMARSQRNRFVAFGSNYFPRPVVRSDRAQSDPSQPAQGCGHRPGQSLGQIEWRVPKETGSSPSEVTTFPDRLSDLTELKVTPASRRKDVVTDPASHWVK